MGIKQYNVQLSEVNVENFLKHYDKKMFSSTLDLLLQKFVMLHSSTREEIAEDAARLLLEEIE